MSIGDDTVCHGCGETIQPMERMHSVRVDGVLDFSFHDACYTAWASTR
jgi:hypothetical protein